MEKKGCTILGGISVAALSACLSQPGWDNREALSCEKVEVQIDGSGRPVEIEYHCTPETVPLAVRSAMNRLYPEGRVVGAEKEYQGRELLWELTVELQGREVEALFTPAGLLRGEEIEVELADAPASVVSAAQSLRLGRIAKVEEIRDAGRTLVEYHVKVEDQRSRVKLRISPEGRVLAALREVPAEIEIPLEEL